MNTLLILTERVYPENGHFLEIHIFVLKGLNPCQFGWNFSPDTRHTVQNECRCQKTVISIIDHRTDESLGAVVREGDGVGGHLKDPAAHKLDYRVNTNLGRNQVVSPSVSK